VIVKNLQHERMYDMGTVGVWSSTLVPMTRQVRVQAAQAVNKCASVL
jgi:hypothetical protein